MAMSPSSPAPGAGARTKVIARTGTAGLFRYRGLAGYPLLLALSGLTLVALAIWTARVPEDDFVNHFAADVDPAKAKVMYAVQQPLLTSALSDVMGVPAWKSLPSWHLVADGDQAIPPDAEQQFAARIRADVDREGRSRSPAIRRDGLPTRMTRSSGS